MRNRSGYDEHMQSMSLEEINDLIRFTQLRYNLLHGKGQLAKTYKRKIEVLIKEREKRFDVKRK